MRIIWAKACIPLISVTEYIIFSVSACCDRKYFNHRKKNRLGYDKPAQLSNESRFSVNEIEALYELFMKLSSIIDDRLIHKPRMKSLPAILSLLISSEDAHSGQIADKETRMIMELVICKIIKHKTVNINKAGATQATQKSS
ncbi:hypothetical protein POM88_054889 [Heracleum sosnowskyi]|uniref:Uncharacterized protein n=1 Tax=Heracleum sosnowskyi TaxID=360622 RepID=A0AAD8LW56_9APIA|nr:hypothetical protein POM88_054889 [Heracleum sosnowskyi]